MNGWGLLLPLVGEKKIPWCKHHQTMKLIWEPYLPARARVEIILLSLWVRAGGPTFTRAGRARGRAKYVMIATFQFLWISKNTAIVWRGCAFFCISVLFLPREAAREASEEIPKEISRKATAEISRETLQKTSRESPRELAEKLPENSQKNSRRSF